MLKILFITESLPKAGSGSGERSLSIYNALLKVANVDVLKIHTGGIQENGSGILFESISIFKGQSNTPWFWRKRKYLLLDYRVDRDIYLQLNYIQKKQKYDLFFCRYFITTVTGADKIAPSILDFDDTPEFMPSPKLFGWRRFGWWLANKRLRKFSTVFVTKKTDISKVGHPDVRVLPCISTLKPSSTCNQDALVRRNVILFVGSMRWAPNRIAVRRFIEECFPAIRSLVPDALFRVVGEDTNHLTDQIGVEGAGFVDDLCDEYTHAKVVICPIELGRGANVKLAEAASFGKAILASRASAAGYEGIFENNVDLLIYFNNAELIEKCVELLINPGLQARLEKSARASAEKHLSQSEINRLVKLAVWDSLGLRE